jgi:PhnB protein
LIAGTGLPILWLSFHPQQDEAAMASKVNPIPQGYHTITPSLIVRDASRAIDFYKKAFGAEERMRMPGPGGRIMHAELRIGDSTIMLADEMPEMSTRSPKALGGSPVGFYVYVENVDAAFKRAVDAGGKAAMPLADMFWGDRIGKVEDPFGHGWTLAQHVKDVTPDEIKRGQEAFLKQMQMQPA